MENANNRREKVLKLINESNEPINATVLAGKLGVSRQAIVGDVAILRAAGHQIIATARGYLTEKPNNDTTYIRKIACQHTPEQTRDELYLLMDLGAIVEDVIIEHDVYGELTGLLRLSSRYDVDLFIERLHSSGAKLLSELTQGIHLHTIRCQSEAHFDKIITVMQAAGLLVNED